MEIVIDGAVIKVEGVRTVREAALRNDIYIPGLCSHPSLDGERKLMLSESVWQSTNCYKYENRGSINNYHCDLCLVEKNGEIIRSCDLKIEEEMVIETQTPDVIKARKENLKKILTYHPHTCLLCPHRNGCDRVQCIMSVNVEERCCELLGRCEIGKVADYIGIASDTPRYKNMSHPIVKDEPLFIRDYELCIKCTRCVRICNDIRGVGALGIVINNREVVVGTTGGPTLRESNCSFCGACVEVCPTGALRFKNDYRRDNIGDAPCVDGCPLGINIPGYIHLIRKGDYANALRLIREDAILPGVLGYACFHPCENVCNRSGLDEPVGICALKRFVSEEAGEEQVIEKCSESTGKSIAVIGSGPSGLAAAGDLLRMGHSVTIYEKSERLGGMLRNAIPDYRLPKDVIDRDLEYLFALGLKVKCNCEIVGRGGVEKLLNDGHDAAIICCGLEDYHKLGVDGEEGDRVIPAIAYLQDAAKGNARKLNGEVVVVGGGSVAVDAAMTALRGGAENVKIVCLEKYGEMPAHPDELNLAIEENIKIINGWGIKKIEKSENENLTIKLKRCKRVFNASGKFQPEYDELETMDLRADWVIIAIGQKIRTDVAKIAAQIKGVFAAGDAISGASSIVQAMADGRRAALDVDRFLGGNGNRYEKMNFKMGGYIGPADDKFYSGKWKPALPPVAMRMQLQGAIVPTMSSEEAMREAGRCLRCNLRGTIATPIMPPGIWKIINAGLQDEAPDEAGVVIFADDMFNIISIKGASSIADEIKKEIKNGSRASRCRWEIDPMFTKRESELIQSYLKEFGKMPDGDDLDDLF